MWVQAIWHILYSRGCLKNKTKQNQTKNIKTGRPGSMACCSPTILLVWKWLACISALWLDTHGKRYCYGACVCMQREGVKWNVGNRHNAFCIGSCPGGPSRKDVRGLGSIPELGRAFGEGHGSTLQYSCLENPMDRSLVGYSPWDYKELTQLRVWPVWENMKVICQNIDKKSLHHLCH